MADWKPYTNEKTGKSGWISAGGQVRYDDPRIAEQAKADRRGKAEDAFQQAVSNKAPLTGEHLEQLKTHLETLTRDRKRELARTISAHVGGLKSHLVDRLLAYAQGKPQPPYPKRPRSETLVAVIQGFGGIDPSSLAFKSVYGSMKDAINDGIALGVFRKKANGGQGLDSLAQELKSSGYISPPDNEHAHEYLLRALKEGIDSLHAQTQDKYEAAYQEYMKVQQEAADYAARNPRAKRVIEETRKRGSERGASQGKATPSEKPLSSNPRHDFEIPW